MKRVFHHYEKWEEYHSGMWRNVPTNERDYFAQNVRAIITNPVSFRASMMRAIEEWPISCEHNLTAGRGINRSAWLWHAGACIATSASEDITRSVWHQITKEQQSIADSIAAECVMEWERKYLSGGQSVVQPLA